jgi:hypothetical protein
MKPIYKIICYFFGGLCLFFGAGLLLMPGRFLGMVYWAPVDPHISRILGAALLAMAWLAWRMVRTTDKDLVSTGTEVFFILTFLSSVGLLRHLLVASYPLVVWILTIAMLLFALYWAIFWFAMHPRRSRT